MEDALEQIRLPCEIELVGAEDGSGVGAAAVAAMMEMTHADSTGAPLPTEKLCAYPGTAVPIQVRDQ